ncbi:MAG TPA: MFS transporter [Chloroflexia bacterium]
MLAGNEISEASKRRGLFSLLITTFFMWAGFFMVIPLMSVYYVDKLGWAAASIGLVLAVRQFTQQGLTPISGMLADRVGAKALILTGVLLRVVGFAALAWADTFPLLLLSTLLAALGGSMFDSPRSAAIAALTNKENRSRFYSLTGMVNNLGLIVGTQVGALLLPVSFDVVALGAALCFLATFFVTLFMLPAVRVSSRDPEEAAGGMTDGLRKALHDKPFMMYNWLLVGYWFMWVQISISLPLAAKGLGGGDETISWIFAINSVLTIAFQYPLIRFASKRLRPLPTLVLGVGTMSLGLGSIALANSIPALMGCVVLYALGGLFASPMQQTVTAELADPRSLGSYFGVNSLALALGGGLGNLSGGLLYDLGKQLAFPELSWLVFCAVGLAATTGLFLLASYLRRRQETAQEPYVEDLASA